MQGSPNPYPGDFARRRVSTRDWLRSDDYKGFGRREPVPAGAGRRCAAPVPRGPTGWLEYASVDRTASLGNAPIKIG
jgi:hypothetical protein